MQIGSGWTIKDDMGYMTGISIKPDDVVCEFYPELKNMRFALKQIPLDQRKSDKSPNWKLECYKLQPVHENGG